MQPEDNKTELYSKLLKGSLQNDRECQFKLYNLLSSKMYAVCLRYVKDREMAEDLLQEGFVKVFSNLEKYRGDGSFEGWVRKIFVNTAIEYYRKSTRMYPIVNLDHAVNDDNVIAFVDDLEVEDLMKMIHKLSPGYRTVFNLYVIEGYSHKEIAELLNITEGTSKSQLARARYLLQDMIVEIEKGDKKNEAIAK
ncbi:MAG: RNA polymerase sigma factor [Chitinophagales bacterium]|nr:RNA polymerase sigma factor [Chitinophagales bacterium]